MDTWEILIAFLGIFSVVLLLTFVTVWFYYYIDEFEPEPVQDLAISFTTGVLALIPAILLLSVLSHLWVSTNLLFTAVIGPICEEITKALLLVILVRRYDVDGPIDGFVYGALLGAGFSCGENLLYGIFGFFQTDSIISGIYIASSRSFFQIIGHPMYSGLFGLGLGKFKVRAKESILDEFALAIGSHMAWNGITQISSWLFIPTIIGLILVLFYILRIKLLDGLHMDRYAYNQGYYHTKEQLKENQETDKLANLVYPLKNTLD